MLRLRYAIVMMCLSLPHLLYFFKLYVVFFIMATQRIHWDERLLGILVSLLGFFIVHLGLCTLCGVWIKIDLAHDSRWYLYEFKLAVGGREGFQHCFQIIQGLSAASLCVFEQVANSL